MLFRSGLTTDLAFELSAAAGIIVDIVMWGTTERTRGICGNGTGFALLRFYRRYCFSVTEAIILIPELPVLLDEGFDDRKLIGSKFLVFGAVDFVMSPLL